MEAWRKTSQARATGVDLVSHLGLLVRRLFRTEGRVKGVWSRSPESRKLGARGSRVLRAGDDRQEYSVPPPTRNGHLHLKRLRLTCVDDTG